MRRSGQIAEDGATRRAIGATQAQGEADQLVVSWRDLREVDPFEQDHPTVEEDPVHRHLVVRVRHGEIVEAAPTEKATKSGS